jgi:hypothetical protein
MNDGSSGLGVHPKVLAAVENLQLDFQDPARLWLNLMGMNHTIITQNDAFFYRDPIRGYFTRRPFE